MRDYFHSYNTEMKLILVLLTAVLTAAAAMAQDDGKSDNAQGRQDLMPVISPEARKAVKAMSDTLGSYKDFSFHADISYDEVLPSGQKIQYSGSAEVAVSRPGMALATVNGDLNDRRLWYSDGILTVLNVTDNLYASAEVPGNLDAAMDHLIENYGFTMPLADIIHSSPYESLMNNVEAGVVVGTSNLDGNQCLHMAFVEKYIDWQLWVSESGGSLPCKLLITYKTIPGAPQYTARFENWKSGEAAGLEKSSFKTDIPKEASKIEFLKKQAEEE